ncbi:TRAF-interacting protein with FHA domain-containing protein A-like [Callorhinchus milii]|uniref:TRAF-interacting protein with FHA domain-containing protein A-like n=1 Tax=Callorhinchus milii TaxID=7868 RepID=UPI0004571C6A|nr:TRAF-interacting protein with FHA domain-containing protein A-like [Callorhinchus milii]XP_007899507.1 TRAF-interacting protein with FHA domain-containing protein A-like [Callorhinchus milii]|eukprot:gi/632966595/ref/XP_007899506.1/ PREDICTED: TRAF-interacting protein with FHA domain-containing protein A-like [Callorhinchus milii]
MDALDDEQTQEKVPCFLIQMYHPEQGNLNVFNFIKFNEKRNYKSYETMTFGRKDTCNVRLSHPRASRLQFQIEAFLTPDNSRLQFEVKNLSDRFLLYLNGQELSYLQKHHLPWSCNLRFSEFEFYLEQEEGETVMQYDVTFQKRTRVPCENESPSVSSQFEMPYQNLHRIFQEPVEVGEDLELHMVS